jgi:hypothetical protein
MVHGGEMVLPSSLSQKVQNMAGDTTNNNVRNGGATIHLNSSPTLHVHSEADGRKLLQDHADHLWRIVQKQSQRFNR